MEVYFDDFKVTQIKSPVVATDDYYPFGLTFNSYRRENSVEQKYKFNGIEEVTDLGLNVLNAKFRILDPAIGRWWQNDPKAEQYYSWSSYDAMGDNPIRIADPFGDEWADEASKKQAAGMESSLNTKNASLEKKNDKLATKEAKAIANGNFNKAGRIAERIGDNKTRVEINKQTVTALQTLGSMPGSTGTNGVKEGYFSFGDKVTIKDNGDGTATQATTFARKADGTYVINNSGSLGNKAHEVMHGYQAATGDVTLQPGTTNISAYGPGVNHQHLENEGYRAHYGATGASGMPSGFKVNGSDGEDFEVSTANYLRSVKK